MWRDSDLDPGVFVGQDDFLFFQVAPSRVVRIGDLDVQSKNVHQRRRRDFGIGVGMVQPVAGIVSQPNRTVAPEPDIGGGPFVDHRAAVAVVVPFEERNFRLKVRGRVRPYGHLVKPGIVVFDTTLDRQRKQIAAVHERADAENVLDFLPVRIGPAAIVRVLNVHPQA